VANARVHGTTGEIPTERLVRERPRLQRGRPMAGARCASSKPGRRRRRSWAFSIGCRSTTRVHQRLAELCRELRLSAVPELYPAVAQDAAAKEASFVEFLEAMLRAERDAQRARAREMFARVAGFPV
jgi:hypothetical protein